MPEYMLRIHLKSTSVDLPMNERKFSMPLSYFFAQNTHPSKWGKKTFSEREKINLKNGAVFANLKKIRHWIIDFGSAVFSPILILGIFYANYFFPVRKVN